MLPEEVLQVLDNVRVSLQWLSRATYPSGIAKVFDVRARSRRIGEELLGGKGM